MTALPDAFNVGPAAVADAVAEGPHTRKLVELAARRSHARRDRVGIVGNVHRAVMPRAASARVTSSARRMPLSWVRLGRVFNHPVANDARHRNADGVDRIGLTLEESFDFVGQQLAKLARGQCSQGIMLASILGKRMVSPESR